MIVFSASSVILARIDFSLEFFGESTKAPIIWNFPIAFSGESAPFAVHLGNEFLELDTPHVAAAALVYTDHRDVGKKSFLVDIGSQNKTE